MARLRLRFLPTLFLCGCGRVGFDASGVGDTGDGGPSGDGRTLLPTLVQATMGAGSSTINVATSPTAAGHLLVIGVASDNGFSAITTVTSIADNAGNTWVSANALSQVTNQHWSSEMWYAANSQSGATTVTVTAPTASAGRLVWFMEVDGIANVAPLDVVVTSSDAAPTSNPKAPLVTPTVLPSLIVSVGNFQETLLGLQMPTMFVALPISSSNNTAYGVAVEPSSYGPVWNDTTSGAYSASTAAFRAR